MDGSELLKTGAKTFGAVGLDERAETELVEMSEARRERNFRKDWTKDEVARLQGGVFGLLNEFGFTGVLSVMGASVLFVKSNMRDGDDPSSDAALSEALRALYVADTVLREFQPALYEIAPPRGEA